MTQAILRSHSAFRHQCVRGHQIGSLGNLEQRRSLTTERPLVAAELERQPATISARVVQGTVSDENEFASSVTPAARDPAVHLPGV
jgi:hypothetical protein